MTEEVNLLDVFNTIIKNKKIILRITIVSSVAIVITMFATTKLPESINFLPNEYTAQSLIKLNENASTNGASSLINSSGLGSMAGLLGVGNGKNTNVAWAIRLSKSRNVLDEIGYEFNLKNLYFENSKNPTLDIRNFLKEKLIVQQDDKTGGLIIKFTDKNKKLSADIVNKLVTILEMAFLNIDLENNQNNIEIMFKKIQSKEIFIEKLVEDLTNFQEKHNILEPNVMSAELTKQIMELRSSVNVKESELHFLQENFSPNSPKVLNKQLELEGAKNLLFNLENGIGSADVPSLKEMPFILVEYEKKRAYIEAQRKIYASLLQQYELMRLKQSGTTAIFQVIEKAEIPLVKSGPYRGKICIFVFLIAFVFSILLVFVKEFCINLYNSRKKIEGE